MLCVFSGYTFDREDSVLQTLPYDIKRCKVLHLKHVLWCGRRCDGVQFLFRFAICKCVPHLWMESFSFQSEEFQECLQFIYFFGVFELLQSKGNDGISIVVSLHVLYMRGWLISCEPGVERFVAVISQRNFPPKWHAFLSQSFPESQTRVKSGEEGGYWSTLKPQSCKAAGKYMITASLFAHLVQLTDPCVPLELVSCNCWAQMNAVQFIRKNTKGITLPPLQYYSL